MAIAVKRHRPMADPYLTSGLMLAVVFCSVFWVLVAIAAVRILSLFN